MIAKIYSSLVFFCIFFLTSISISGAKVNTGKEKWSNLNYSYLECISFYKISIQGFKNRSDSKSRKIQNTIRELKQRFESSLQSALTTAKLAQLSEKGFMTRLALVETTHKEEISYNISNISILMQKYLKPCAVLTD